MYICIPILKSSVKFKWSFGKRLTQGKEHFELLVKLDTMLILGIFFLSV